MQSTITILTAFLCVSAEPLRPGDQTRSVRVGDLERRFIVHVPPGIAAEKSAPVVFGFHGGGGNPEYFIRKTGLNAKADEAGFIAVYPYGTGRFERLLTWNGGNCCGYAMRNEIDDVAFVRSILDDLESSADIDRDRVFATGHSNGAILCYRLASELSDRIAAIAPVGGPMGTKNCSPKHPVSVIHFHGSDDQNAPLAGGSGSRSVSGTNFFSVKHSVGAWVAANGCDSDPISENLPDKANDGTTVTTKTYGPGKDGSEVVLVVVHGGGHTWPGKSPARRAAGKSTLDISANDMMWDFFEKHARR